MRLQDISNGSGWVMWLVFVFFLLISIVFLTGHGAGLIAGYNTASEEEKNKYDEKKMCKVMGVGMSVITVFLFVMAKWESVLPAEIAYVFLGVVIIDCIVIIILLNTICCRR